MTILSSFSQLVVPPEAGVPLPPMDDGLGVVNRFPVPGNTSYLAVPNVLWEDGNVYTNWINANGNANQQAQHAAFGGVLMNWPAGNEADALAVVVAATAEALLDVANRPGMVVLDTEKLGTWTWGADNPTKLQWTWPEILAAVSPLCHAAGRRVGVYNLLGICESDNNGVITNDFNSYWAEVAAAVGTNLSNVMLEYYPYGVRCCQGTVSPGVQDQVARFIAGHRAARKKALQHFPWATVSFPVIGIWHDFYNAGFKTGIGLTCWAGGNTWVTPVSGFTTQVYTGSNTTNNRNIGNILEITSGAGWTAGLYEIIAADETNSRWKLDRSPAAAGTTGGVGTFHNKLPDWFIGRTNMLFKEALETGDKVLLFNNEAPRDDYFVGRLQALPTSFQQAEIDTKPYFLTSFDTGAPTELGTATGTYNFTDGATYAGASIIPNDPTGKSAVFTSGAGNVGIQTITPGFRACSIEAWVKPSLLPVAGDPNGMTIVSSRTSNGFMFHIQRDRLKWWGNFNAWAVESSVFTWAADDVMCIAVGYDPEIGYFFMLNGLVIGSGGIGAVGAMDAASQQFRIGSTIDSWFFKGLIQRPKVWPRWVDPGAMRASYEHSGGVVGTL